MIIQFVNRMSLLKTDFIQKNYFQSFRVPQIELSVSMVKYMERGNDIWPSYVAHSNCFIIRAHTDEEKIVIQEFHYDNFLLYFNKFYLLFSISTDLYAPIVVCKFIQIPIHVFVLYSRLRVTMVHIFVFELDFTSCSSYLLLHLVNHNKQVLKKNSSGVPIFVLQVRTWLKTIFSVANKC